MTNQQIITDASGKLKKLGSRASGIYVDYLGGWSRADNYRHKHDKMQNVLMGYLKKARGFHWLSFIWLRFTCLSFTGQVLIGYIQLVRFLLVKFLLVKFTRLSLTG